MGDYYFGVCSRCYSQVRPKGITKNDLLKM